jgi:hypothetical protein
VRFWVILTLLISSVICIGENFKILSKVLPVVGTVAGHGIKKGEKRLNNEEYLSIPYSFIAGALRGLPPKAPAPAGAFLVGLIDGDGYIQVTRALKPYNYSTGYFNTFR